MDADSRSPEPPYTDEYVSALPLAEARHELLEAIMATPTIQTTRSAPSQPPRRRRWLVVAATAAAVLIAVAVPFALVGDNGADDSAAYPTWAVAAAEETPRVLVDAPGWSITDVDGFGSAEGELEFTNGDQELQVNWREAADYRDQLADRGDVDPGRPVDLLGSPSTLFTYGPGDYTTIRPVEGDSFLEVRGGVGDLAAYRAVLQQLVITDVETWLAAMPPEIVMPSERVDTIMDMLQGVPTPPDFDIATIPSDDLGDRYDYGADVTGAVTCAWIERWRLARQRGDEAAVAEVVEALQTSRQWPILREMNEQGDYPEVVWEISNEVAAGRFPVEYRQGLGCP